MSHKISMTVFNRSSEILSHYRVCHTCDGQTDSIIGDNLGMNKFSKPIEIVTGFGNEMDEYEIEIFLKNGRSFFEKFCRNSSPNQISVIIQINDQGCDCGYFKSVG